MQFEIKTENTPKTISHNLVIILKPDSYAGQCGGCGWRCERGRLRDVRRMFRLAHADKEGV